MALIFESTRAPAKVSDRLGAVPKPKTKGIPVNGRGVPGRRISEKFKLEPESGTSLNKVVSGLITDRGKNPHKCRGEKCIEDFFPPTARK